MNTDELRAEIKTLHKTHTAAEIAILCNCQHQRVRLNASRLGIKCKLFLGQIERHHARIVELSKTNTPAQIALELGISRVQLYSYNQKHGIVCKKATIPRKNYKDGCVRALTNGPTGEQITFNIIRLAGYKPVYALNKTKPNGRDIVLTGEYQIGENIVLPNYEAVQKFAAAL